jgi:hypothetical protein
MGYGPYLTSVVTTQIQVGLVGAEVSVFRSPAGKFSATLLRGSMANRRKQGFRLVRVMALSPVWDVCSSCSSRSNAGCLQRGACKRCAGVRVFA